MVIELHDGSDVTPQSRTAIVSIVIGDLYQAAWEILCRESWEHYAQRLGFDILIIKEPLDRSARAASRSLAWQKLLVLDQPWSRKYDRVIWLDADIIISKHAFNILNSARDVTRVGGCVSGDQFSIAERHVYAEILHGRRFSPSDAEMVWGFIEENSFEPQQGDASGVPVVNTGVLVASPAHHNDLFLGTYAENASSNSRLYEQSFLSKALHDLGLLERLSPRFNWTIHERLVLDYPKEVEEGGEALDRVFPHLRNELERKAYFLHFAGSQGVLLRLAQLALRGDDVLGVVGTAT